MQLGTRWTAGGEPPASVPAALRVQIAAVEAVIPADQLRTAGLNPLAGDAVHVELPAGSSTT